MLKTVQEDVQHYIEFGKPIGPVHIVVMGTDRHVEEMRNTCKHRTDSFGE